eukprot:6295189-Pyramimonas_sp.AAC.1
MSATRRTGGKGQVAHTFCIGPRVLSQHWEAGATECPGVVPMGSLTATWSRAVRHYATCLCPFQTPAINCAGTA